MTKADEFISDEARAKEAEANAEARKQRNRVPFPLAGEKAFFWFSMRGLVAFQTAIEEAEGGSLRGDFFQACERHLLGGTPSVAVSAVDVALKTIDEEGNVIPFRCDIDELPWSVAEIAEPAMNAYSLSLLGKSYLELIEEARARLEDNQGEAA